jgi:hypothetical protein
VDRRPWTLRNAGRAITNQEPQSEGLLEFAALFSPSSPASGHTTSPPLSGGLDIAVIYRQLVSTLAVVCPGSRHACP